MISGRLFTENRFNLHSIVALLLAITLLPATWGCGMFRTATQPAQESDWYIGPQEVIWDATLEAVSQRYQLRDVNRAKGTIESKPVERLSPFKGEGLRRQLKGSIEKDGNRYRIKLRVWVETNMELDQPLVSEEAKWKRKRTDDVAAQVLLAQIETILKESGIVTVAGGA